MHRMEYLRNMLVVMAQQAGLFASLLTEQAGGGAVEMEDACHRLTLDILGLSSFKYSFNALDGECE